MWNTGESLEGLKASRHVSLLSQITEAYFLSAWMQDEVIHRSVLKLESTDNKGIA